MAKIIDARVVQKTATLAEWNASTLKTLDGEQLFIKSNVDDEVIGFKLGSNGKTFSELPYPKYSVRGKVNTQSVWQGAISGVYLPVEDGVYNGITVKLSDGYQVLYWDGTTLVKVLYDKLSNIIDNLQSDSATESLSANQGRLLNQSKENVSNKSQELDDSTTKYPSNKAVKDYVDSIIVEPSGVNFGGTISPDFVFDEGSANMFWFATPGAYNIPTIGEVNLTDNLNIISVNNSGEWDYKAVPINVEQDFLTYDTISELRSMPSTHISLLSSGAVKGARLLGFYSKGDIDTIDYYVSNTDKTADACAVIQVGSIKLEHDFGTEIFIENLGGKADGKVFEGIGSMEFNSNVLTTSQPVFQSSDVGKIICIQGAGTLASSSFRVLSTVISAYDSPTQVRLQTLSTYAVSGVKVEFGTDNTAAVLKFNAWAKDRDNEFIKLKIKNPYGEVHYKSARWTYNILNLIVEGGDCDFINIATNAWDRCPLFTCANLKRDQKDGDLPGNAEGYLINTAQANSRSVTTKTVSDSANFVVGEWVGIMSQITSLVGFPPDYKKFDYVRITGIDAVTGAISIHKPLKFTHKDNALWSVASDTSQRVSGRASIIKLERGSKFGINHLYNNINFSCSTVADGGAVRCSGLNVTFNKCSSQIWVPTGAEDVTFMYCRQLNPTSNEFDKLVTRVTDFGGNWKIITNGGGVLTATFNQSFVERIESLSCRRIELNDIYKFGDVGSTTFVIGDRPGGTKGLSMRGGLYNEEPKYPLQLGQAKKVVIGSGGVTYADGKLMMPFNNDTISLLNYIDIGDRMDVFVPGTTKALCTNNRGYVNDMTSDDGITANIYVTFKNPLANGDIPGIFTEPNSVDITGVVVNDKKLADRKYVQMTLNPRIYDARIGQGYNTTLNMYGGAIRRMMVNVKKPYTGTSASAQLRIESTYPSTLAIATIDLKTSGLREVDFRGTTGALGTDVLPSIFEVNASQFKNEIKLRSLGTIAGSSNDYAIVTFELDITEV